MIDSNSKEYKIMKMSEIDDGIDDNAAQEEITVIIKNWTSDRTLVKLETHYFLIKFSRRAEPSLK